VKPPGAWESEERAGVEREGEEGGEGAEEKKEVEEGKESVQEKARLICCQGQHGAR
jgi:hypothetical protein